MENFHIPPAIKGAKKIPEKKVTLGDWIDHRSALTNNGIVPYGIFTTQLARVFEGGLHTGNSLEGLLEFGADFDLEKLRIMEGATVHASGLWIQDSSNFSATHVGNFDEFSNIAAVSALRLYQLNLRKSFLNQKLSVKIGQVALDDDFMISAQSLLFTNASLGTLPLLSANTSGPIYPLSALGAWGMMEFSKSFSFQSGIYDGDAGTQDNNREGFNYKVNTNQGEIILGEAIFSEEINGQHGTYKLGGYYHTGKFSSYQNGANHYGNQSFYAVFDQALSGPTAHPSLGVFLRSGMTPRTSQNEVDRSLDLGMTGRGFLPDDHAGIAFSHAHFSDAFVRSSKKAGAPVSNDESVIELSYQRQAKSWLIIQPDLQYVINPQNSQARNALVGAVRLRLSL